MLVKVKTWESKETRLSSRDPKNSEVFQTRISQEVLDYLKEMAQDKGTTVSEVVRSLVTEEVQEYFAKTPEGFSEGGYFYKVTTETADCDYDFKSLEEYYKPVEVELFFREREDLPFKSATEVEKVLRPLKPSTVSIRNDTFNPGVGVTIPYPEGDDADELLRKIGSLFPSCYVRIRCPRDFEEEPKIFPAKNLPTLMGGRGVSFHIKDLQNVPSIPAVIQRNFSVAYENAMYEGLGGYSGETLPSIFEAYKMVVRYLMAIEKSQSHKVKWNSARVILNRIQGWNMQVADTNRSFGYSAVQKIHELIRGR